MSDNERGKSTKLFTPIEGPIDKLMQPLYGQIRKASSGAASGPTHGGRRDTPALDDLEAGCGCEKSSD
jgi:hypothetical protein